MIKLIIISLFVSECGGSLSGTEGVIVHPNHPGNYKNSRNCQYVITVAPDRVIQIVFEKIDLEASDRCSYDYIELQDTSKGTRLKVCRPTTTPYISGGRSLVVKFYTDESTYKSGFMLKWRSMSTVSTTTKPSAAKTTSTTTTTTTTTTPSTTEATPVTVPIRGLHFIQTIRKYI